jgi:hypothetical protein
MHIFFGVRRKKAQRRFCCLEPGTKNIFSIDYAYSILLVLKKKQKKENKANPSCRW